ncbi:sensor histidine kinase [Paenibacillus sp. FA6]|uniref:sensor histidine kinase n=1 Tax=Paenibacillus sp. FA6 TaxID=3413029 RepID=UPI003F65E53D
MNRWQSYALICVIVIIGCTTYTWVNPLGSDQASESKFVINQVRVQLSDIMQYLEQHHKDISTDPYMQKTMRAMIEDRGVNLIYSLLDGNVAFTVPLEQSIQHIDVRTSLHYDLYTSRVDKDMFKITFPVIDEVSQVQVGNAIFTMPESMVLNEQSHSMSWIPFVIIILCGIFLIILLFILLRKIKNHAIKPIYQLKNYSEAILKGNYEPQFTYGRMDEVGEVYAMFDQMRIEIMSLNIQRAEQDTAQKELISNISHDIKTPLTTIKAYIEAIHAGVCPDIPSIMEYMEVMQTNANQMTRLIEDLLVHALSELGQISVTLTEQYSRDILLNILKPIGHYVRTTGVVFTEPKQEDVPNVLIHVDATRLEQVISNLIANALKHTSAGDTIRIHIELQPEQLTFTISDTGEGILPQEMPFIFERYFQGRVSSYQSIHRNEGAGLGLSICKHIIEAHKGTISFKSVKGQGTEFFCAIPLC